MKPLLYLYNFSYSCPTASKKGRPNIYQESYKPCIRKTLCYFIASSTATAQATVVPTMGFIASKPAVVGLD